MLKTLCHAAIGIAVPALGATLLFFDPIAVYGAILGFVFLVIAVIGIFYSRREKEEKVEDES